MQNIVCIYISIHVFLYVYHHWLQTSTTAQSEFESFVLHEQDSRTWVYVHICCSNLQFRRHDRYACASLLLCEYWYQVLLSIVSSIVLVPICCTDIFVCKRMYTIDLNFNHAHHRDTYRYICSTHIFACKRTYQYAYD